MARSAQDIIGAAEELLRDARFGLEDMLTRPGRAKTGLRNAVVFGRAVTFALQNLRSVVPDFDTWYGPKRAEMKADSLMRFFHDLRNSIEKQAHTPTSTSMHIVSFSDRDFARLEPRPPGATGIFIGDHNGGSGWIVPKPDGSQERYYVELPPDIGEVRLDLVDAPKIAGLEGAQATDLLRVYLEKVEAIVHEARQRFASA